MTGQRGSGLAVIYAFGLSLVVAPHLPYGLAVWAAFWCAVIYRATSKPRTRGAQLTTGEAQSER